MRPHATLLAAALVAAGCIDDGSPADDGWSEGGKLDDPSTGGVLPTMAIDTRVLSGFHALLDTPAGPCVEATGSGPAYTVGTVEKPFELSFVSTKDDLARTLGIDPSLKLKFGEASLSATASFMRSFKKTSTAIHLLLGARARYRVTNARSVRLTAEALDWLAHDPKLFLHRCGNFFVNGVELEAQLFVMIRLDALTSDASRTITAELGLGPISQLMSIDASLKAKLERLAKREDVAVELNVLDRGFLADGGTTALIGSLLGSGLSAASFDKIDMLRAAMLKSLNGDVCRDGGIGLDTCPGERVGYDANVARNAIPVNVNLRAYSRATNAPIGGPGSPYEIIRDLVDNANRYLRPLAKLSSRMEAITNDEIAAFASAPAERKTNFGVMPPAPPVYALDALTAIANRFRERLDSKQTTSVAAALDSHIATCWAGIAEGVIDACAGSSAMLPQVQAAEAAIAEYIAAGRIVPLQLTSRGLLGSSAAANACAQAASRLPTFAEAQRMAIAIGYGAFPRSTDAALTYAAWHSERSMCASNQAPAFANRPGTTPGTVCASDGLLSSRATLTLCVPPGGPFASVPPP